MRDEYYRHEKKQQQSQVHRLTEMGLEGVRLQHDAQNVHELVVEQRHQTAKMEPEGKCQQRYGVWDEQEAQQQNEVQRNKEDAEGAAQYPNPGSSPPPQQQKRAMGDERCQRGSTQSASQPAGRKVEEQADGKESCAPADSGTQWSWWGREFLLSWPARDFQLILESPCVPLSKYMCVLRRACLAHYFARCAFAAPERRGG